MVTLNTFALECPRCTSWMWIFLERGLGIVPDATAQEKFNFLRRAINTSNHLSLGFIRLVLELYFPAGIQELLQFL